MTSRRPVRHAILVGVGLFGVAIADSGHAVRAQGRLDARYTATLGGLSFGKGSWLIDVRDDQFSMSVSGATSGILRVFASARGTSEATGNIVHGQPIGTSFASSIVADRKHDDVRMVMSGGVVKAYDAEPPTPPSPGRIPLTNAHRRNVSDPMTAALMRVSSTGDTFAPDGCHRTLAIFDGRLRYDLQLAYKRLDKVKSEKGYQGTVLVCSVHFTPIAGHVPNRPVIKYLVEQRNIELWLAPVAGTRLLVPYRVSIPTPLGMGILQATQFVSVPYPPAASPTSLKTP